MLFRSLDTHPDSFTAAVLRGPTPAAAIVEKVFNKLPMTELQSWAKKNTTAQDRFVLEASGNSFYVVRSLGALSRQAEVLESAHLGRLKEAHANNDQISAVERFVDRLADSFGAVRGGDLPGHEIAAVGELPAEPLLVGIQHSAQQQFRARVDNFDIQRAQFCRSNFKDESPKVAKAAR